LRENNPPKTIEETKEVLIKSIEKEVTLIKALT
jgi:hypothetical protein